MLRSSASPCSNLKSQTTNSKMSRLLFLFPIVFVIISLHLANGLNIGPFSGIRGDFCKNRIGGCCPGRIDDCSTPIFGTLCYCDVFCNRTDNPDCCPDYYSFCLGIEQPTEPPESLQRCFYQGRYYNEGETLKINCNECKCEKAPSGNNLEFLCERESCIIEPELIDVVNTGNFYWKARNYSDFWGKKLSDGILYKLGTLEPERAVRNMKPIKLVYDKDFIPRSFDSRDKWRNLLMPINNQGWCGGDWAVTTTSVIGDRLSIQTNGEEKIVLSSQQLIDCNNHGHGNNGCKGGHLDRSWNFMRRFGVVDEECYPYESGEDGNARKCKVSRKIKSILEMNCRSSNSVVGRRELYKSQPAYRISSKVEDIQYEIVTYGPVQAVMSVSADFFMYKNGVYKKSELRPTDRTGYHSVKIIGWGEEFHEGVIVKYWLVANSWGEEWGENGYFKILRGENECEIENFIIGAWARTDRNYNGVNGNHHG